MKRGFLNGKKAKDQPLSAVGSAKPTAKRTVMPPPRKSGDGDTASVSCPKELSEPVLGSKIMEGRLNSRISEPFAVVSVPSPKSTKSNVPSSTCLFRQSTYNMIANAPGFYTPPRPLNPTDVVFTKNTPNMGVALFAKRNIKSAHIVFTERPLLIFPRGMPFLGRSRDEAIKMHESVFEKELQRALNVMTKEDVDAYLSLSNCCPSGTPRLYGISKTNAFDTDIGDENPEEGGCEYAAVGTLVSRINHSCLPNAVVRFHIPTFSLRVVALRDIKAGDQILTCYCQPNTSAEERRRQLASYRFECQCKVCVNATPESDRLRAEMDERLQKLVKEKEEMFANPGFSIRPLVKLEKDIVNEGLDIGQMFLDLLYIIYQAYGKLKDRAKETEYLNKVNKYMQRADTLRMAFTN